MAEPAERVKVAPSRRRQPTRRERGLAIAMTSLVLIPLMAFAAFGVDLAGWYARISDIQRAADAAALAGAVWMPDLGRATLEANNSLQSNGFAHGVNGIEVEVERGSTATSLRVTVTDTNARRYFSSVISDGPQQLTRFAEAEYNLPLPLGSPLNYFGGDRSKMSDSNPTATGTDSGANSPFPQPDYTTRRPANPGGSGTRGCVAREGGAPAGVILGLWWVSSGGWTNSTWYPGNYPGYPLCSWDVFSTTASSLPGGATTIAPTNQPCMVGYEASRGWWNGGVFSTTGVPAGLSQAAGNRLCQWSVPNPIAVGRSPGFWAQIHGPGADQQSGDAFSTRCRTTTNCSSPDNNLYVDPSNPNHGYWYVLRVPPGGGGQTVIRIFDAQLTPGDLNVGTGDSSISGTADFTTSYRVYRQTNPLDFTLRTAVGSSTANQTPNSCNWDVRGQSQFRFQWVDLCTVSTAPGDIYLINVRTTNPGVTSTAGRNGYALEACLTSSCTAGTQPALYAFERMVLYNNIDSGNATFYIAEVAPQYAGKTLVIEMFDPGEASGQAWVFPRMPSATQVGTPNSVATANCDISSTRSGYPRGSDLNNGGVCSFRSSDGGALYNGQWVTMRIQIPSTYTCTVGINPVTTPGSCWWGIRYNFSASATDTTTWRAHIEGNPLQLTQ